MAYRLAKGGRLIDRSEPRTFRFDGKRIQGFKGDTLASALLANDTLLVNRSFKYHRPRGIVAAGAEEPNALLGVGLGDRFEPNQRATTTELVDGMRTHSQNRWPSLGLDVGALNAWLAEIAPIFPAGFYYKTFINPRVAWKHVYEPFIRRAAGLGRAPDAEARDPDSYEHVHAFCDVLVVGGGVAGLRAARVAAEAGADVILLEQTAHWGGRALVDDEVEIDRMPAPDWVAAEVSALAAMPNVRMRSRTMGAGVYDHGFVLGYERVGDHLKGHTGPRHRLWKIRTRQTVVATGAIERPVTFAQNDLPGVMLASAVRDYVKLYGVVPGQDAIVFANNDDAYRTALTLAEAGARVRTVLDVRREARGPLADAVRAKGIKIETQTGIFGVEGGKRVKAAFVGSLTGGPTRKVYCDLIAMSGGWSPVVHLWSHTGGKLRWDDEGAMFRPAAERGAPRGADGEAAARVAGAANGHLLTVPCLTDAAEAGAEATARLGLDADAEAPAVDAPAEAPLAPFWWTPAKGHYDHGFKHFVDFQNDVTAADVRLAAREGYRSVEHTKRYTTLGMATDQGKTSNINGLALLADQLGLPVEEVGTTTFRPPYTPISFGAITGAATGPLFKPVRRTPMHGWHDANGADWEPVADWYRPYCYRRPGETRDAAVRREVTGVRAAVGMIDASTLGKIEVRGPDAARFLDRVYTNTMSSLKPGRCRYGLMLNENGFLFDDGVVVRLAEDRFLCHTTSGGSDRVHAHLEEWLQTEWWDLKVFTANVTERWAQVAVAGPEARKLLASLDCDIDLGAEALPFMSCAEGRLAGCPARVFRISFSGELGFEVAVPANYGRHLWDRLLETGAPYGLTVYGTEALHAMRAEKGFIMIGDETDGTVTPHDLALSWAVSKKKDDFIGKRALERSDLVREGRKQLVGLATEEPQTVLPDGAHAVDAVHGGPPMRTIGHVTSTYWSPTLGRSIAMALIEGGAAREGAWLDFPVAEGKVIRAQVVSPQFYDPAGEKMHG